MTATITARRTRIEPVTVRLPPLIPALVTAAVASATVEVVLLRLISRIGVHIPAMDWARGTYTVAVAAGNLMFPLAAIFATATVAVLALTLLRHAPAPAVLALALVGLQVWLLRGTSAGSVAAHELLLAANLLAIAVSTAGAVTATGSGRGAMLFVALVAIAQGLGQVQAASANLAALGSPVLPLAIVTVGELVLLGAWLATPALLAPRAWPRSALIAGGLAALVTLGSLAGNGSTTRILALWTFGLAMPAPAVCYVFAAAALVATAVAQARTGAGVTAAGLILLALGGYIPPSTYQADLVLAGAMLISLPLLQQAGRGAILLASPHPRAAMALDRAPAPPAEANLHHLTALSQAQLRDQL